METNVDWTSEFGTPTDTEYIDMLEKAVHEIDGLIDTMHNAPRDSSGDEEFDVAYKSYNDIATCLYYSAHNRYVEENKPDDE